MVGVAAVISNLQSVLVNHIFPDFSILLQVESWVPWFGQGDEVSG